MNINFECIKCAQEEDIAIITLNRPDRLNATSRQLWDDLGATLDKAVADPATKVVILTGEGRAFSAGADLKESKTRSNTEYRDYLVKVQATSKQLLGLSKPTIAAINGYALGTGCELALACDVRIAAEEAQLGFPEAKVTSSVTGAGLRLIQDLIGPAKARELLFTGEFVDGKEAERIGLVNKSVPLATLMKTAREMAHRMANNSSFSIETIKKGLQAANSGMSLEELMEYEIEACLACVASKEREEALKVFEDRKQVE
jgi:enoyl-CoA hydratase